MIENFQYIIMDASSSMGSIRTETVNAVNSILASFQIKVKGQRTKVSLQLFADHPHDPILFNVPAEMVRPLMYGQYYPDGWTQLFGTVLDGEARLSPFDTRGNKSFNVIAITDGDDNWSFDKVQKCVKMMREKDDNWTFAFQVPKGKRDGFIRSYGVPPGNVSEWEATPAGVAKMAIETTQAIGNYYEDRAMGKRGTKNFFAKPDLSGVEVADELEDMAGKFRILTVGPRPGGKEWKIKPFVESMLGAYVRGRGYYQLMKPEEVQDYKKVLIMDGRKLYGGPQARGLIGLSGSGTANIVPGNHDRYTIFIQSKSVNRVLPRGTKVLVEK